MALGNDGKGSRKRVQTARHSENQPTLSGPIFEFQGGREAIGYWEHLTWRTVKCCELYYSRR